MAGVEASEQQAATGEYLNAYCRMLLIREFETAIHRLFLSGEVHGTTHLYAGQEAVAVGVCMALEADDYVAGTYRGHGHALAKGTAPEPLIAEMLGRGTGICGGRAGSMNVIDLEHGLLGCYGIVGGSIAAASEPASRPSAKGACRSASSATALPTRATSTSASTWRRSSSSQSCSVREQPLRGVHAARRRDSRGRHRGPRELVCPAVGGRRRQRPVGGPRGGRVRRAAGPRRRRADAARVQDLSALRPLQGRPCPVPVKGRAADLARTRPAQARPRPAARRQPDRGSDCGRRGSHQGADRARDRGCAGRPVPRPGADAATEFAGERRSSSAPRSAMRSPRSSTRPVGDVLRRGRRDGRRGVQGDARSVRRFGPERVFDTPISELALAGAAYGAAVTGLRPVIEVMFGDFMGLAMDSLVNQAAKYWYISNQQGSATRSPFGGRRPAVASGRSTHRTTGRGSGRTRLEDCVPVLAR